MPIQFTPEMRAKGVEAVKARKAARDATRETLADGYVLYKDTEPGIGWVVEKTANRHKKYYATPEVAKKHFFEFYKGRF